VVSRFHTRSENGKRGNERSTRGRRMKSRRKGKKEVARNLGEGQKRGKSFIEKTL